MEENIIIPDGYILIEDPAIVAERQRLEKIKELEDLINNTPIPTEVELIEYGKMSHPYYETLRELELLKNNMI